VKLLFLLMFLSIVVTDMHSAVSDYEVFMRECKQQNVLTPVGELLSVCVWKDYWSRQVLSLK